MKTIKLLLTVLIVFSAVRTSISAEKFYFDADYSVFRSSTAKSILEVYFAFTQRGLLFVKSGSDFTAEVNTQIIILDKLNSKEIFNEIYGLKTKVTDTLSQKLVSRLIGQQNLTVPNGDYVLSFIGYDRNNPERKDTIKLELNLNNFEESRTSISSLQLASKIEKSSDNSSIFYKNGLEITPNPNLLFGSNLNKLYYYAEIYYPAADFSSDSSYFSITVTDQSGKLLIEKRKQVSVKNEVYAETGFLKVDSLLTGSYFITSALIDNTSGKKISREKKFYIYNTSFTKQDFSVPDDAGYMQSEFILLTDAQVEDEFDKIIYYRNTAENDAWEKLKTLDEKRKYLYKFWKRRDTNLSTPRVESRDEYFKRVKEANRSYKQSFTEGWKTDRGRVYIVYGPPTEVERHFMEADVKNYEIWRYDYFEGGTMCVFAEIQTSGEGSYFLVHSTMRGELKDYEWYVKLKK